MVRLSLVSDGALRLNITLILGHHFQWWTRKGSTVPAENEIGSSPESPKGTEGGRTYARLVKSIACSVGL